MQGNASSRREALAKKLMGWLRPPERSHPACQAYRPSTPTGTPTYPTAREVNVPLPWVRLRKRVA